MAGYLPPGGNDLVSEAFKRRRALLLVHYLAVLIAAELLIAFASVTGNEWSALLGLILEIFLMLSFPVLASLLVARDKPLASFLGALMLAPLLRVVSLATPVTPFTTIEWLAIISVPLLLAAGAVMHAQGLRPRDVFLSLGVRRYAPLTVALVAAGFAIGLLEFQVIRPEPWIEGSGSSEFPLAVVAIFLTTGLTEELIFRGILLRTGIPLLGRRGAVAYVSVVFASLHIGFMSAPELLIAFVVGLVFGAVVLLTRSIWGAVGSHTLANVALYLLLPFGL